MFGFFFGNLNDATMFGRNEIGSFHHTLVESSQWGKRLEVGGFHESEVVGIDAIDIVHHHPFILSNPFPSVGSLATAPFGINLFVMIVVVGIDAVGNHVL